ncbi:Gfo/Idh/MocA family protein [Cohnella sp. GCM10027633]|uniref:Gfo/Idh/MocA family protein n=1 Tax=unclassified Cohnella TaxID=2636738 RepID=UPI003639994F
MLVNRKFRIGIIGAGTISSMHVQAYRRLGEQCEIVAAADLTEANARQLLIGNGIEGTSYGHYADLLKRDDIDVVSICTPPFAREDLVIAALAAGKHVMCEKPFASSLEECDRMLEAAQRYGMKLGVMLQTRCEEDVRRARHLVETDALGPIVYARGANHHWRGDAYYNKAWRGTWERERGGTLMNLGIHTLDVMLWILGDLESVKAEAGTLAHNIETDDVNLALLKFRRGTIGEFVCTTTFPISGSRLELSGKTSMVGCFPFEIAAAKEKASGFPVEDREAADELSRRAEEIKPGLDGFEGPIEDLFEAIREGREPVTGGQSVRRTVEAVTAIYKAATLDTAVKLPIGKDDPWYTTEGFHRLVRKATRQPDGRISQES